MVNKYRIISRGNKKDNKIVNFKLDDARWKRTWAKFKTKKELLTFLHSKFSFRDYKEYRKGYHNLVESNSALRNCCHNWNDCTYSYKPLYKNINDEVYFIGYEKEKHFFSYMIIDPYNRIMNIPDLAQEAFEFKPDPIKYKRINWTYNWEPKPNSKWELWKRRGEPKRSNYYRVQKTTNEMRQGYNPEHIPYVRPKRRPMYLERWNIEKHPCVQITWKKLKIRKQWMEHLK